MAYPLWLILVSLFTFQDYGLFYSLLLLLEDLLKDIVRQSAETSKS